MVSLIQSMVPIQDGAAAPEPEAGYDDPAANARAIKSLSYFLGAEMTGICEIPRLRLVFPSQKRHRDCALQ